MVRNVAHDFDTLEDINIAKAIKKTIIFLKDEMKR